MEIAVYCGANKGKQKIYEEAAISLGNWIVENNNSLVYGGGKVGLMGAVADAVLAAGGQAIGVIPTFLQKKELAHPRLTKLYVVDSMSERKQKMASLAQAFIALPGGPGTLEEISEMVSWTRVGQNPYPCIFFNVANYYAPLEKMFDEMVLQGFLSAEDRKQILFSESLTEIAAFIKTYKPL
ncbi:TIGR00730 family Rossman fold protein [Enterococcus sp. HY326]|uniref:LOG family protein n=1 Tax=Enterococcus sp. HY326 TaxID=2971265 RepID=UPI00223F85FA|nr:TIGR00730 family Rossman fold protein [Enterococcus sp. HY326]